MSSNTAASTAIPKNIEGNSKQQNMTGSPMHCVTVQIYRSIYIYIHTHTHTQTYKCSFRRQNAKQDVVPWTPIELDCVYRLNTLLVFFILFLPSFHSPLLPPGNFHCSLTNAMFVHEDLDMFYHGTRSLGFLCGELFASRPTATR